MKREFVAKIAIDKNVSQKVLETNGGDISIAGTGAYLEQEFGWINDSGIYLRDYITTDENDRWSKYINYLIKWAMEHSGAEYDGMSPACYDEWRDNEDDCE